MVKNDIQKKEETTPQEYVYETYTKKNESDDSNLVVPFKDVINKVLSFVNVTDIIKNIKKGSEYVVQIPVEFKKQFESGEFWIMKNLKNGKEWPTLMKKGSGGKNEIVTPLSIKKKSFIQGNPIQDLTYQFQMMQLQSQIKEQNAILDEIYKTVQHIEKGQMNDRIALLISGREQIYFALSRDDSDPGKRTAIENGISEMINAQNQIFKELELQISEFDAIPNSYIKRFLEGLVHINYLNKKSNLYNKICDYFDLYKEATKYIALAHIVIDQDEVVGSIYDNAIHKIQSIDFNNLRTIEYVHSNNNYSFLYENAVFELKSDWKDCMKIQKKYDSLSFEFMGEQLLEEIQNER